MSLGGTNLDIRYLQNCDSLIGSEDRLKVHLAPPLCDVPPPEEAVISTARRVLSQSAGPQAW